ncbi:hypothetical protein CEV33_1319 [Brucella grignonensis]|uniref:Uncharacterized protein n=1 Tax=Brucella grignonensis TaxID=94627 RepID=A0A256FCE4_9HYPH|nr:hypothetical protein CEV33_1319 [Brucella grignonensis]
MGAREKRLREPPIDAPSARVSLDVLRDPNCGAGDLGQHSG